MGARCGTVLDLLQHFDCGPSNQTRLESTPAQRAKRAPPALTTESAWCGGSHFSIGDTPVTALGFEQLFVAIPAILERQRR